MEPSLGDPQLVPRAMKEAAAPDASCGRAALPALAAASFAVVTVGVLVGEWPWAPRGDRGARARRGRWALQAARRQADRQGPGTQVLQPSGPLGNGQRETQADRDGERF